MVEQAFAPVTAYDNLLKCTFSNVKNNISDEVATFYCLMGLNRFAQREARGND